jgi:hypothetical protein
LRTPVGVLTLERVTVVDEGDITADDVRRTRMSPDDLRASLAGEGALLRIELQLVSDDPRAVLRARRPTEDELRAIRARLGRLDGVASTPWTLRYLQMIAGQPGTAARVLASQVDTELLPFKRRVRQLKELGLTESPDVGYRLSPRGEEVLAHLLSHWG